MEEPNRKEPEPKFGTPKPVADPPFWIKRIEEDLKKRGVIAEEEK